MKVLLLEDDSAFARVLARQLGQYDYQVQHIVQLCELMPVGQSFQPDIVLLDMNLGNESSIPQINALRQLLPKSKIILVTGYASIATTVAAIKAGADDYLPKPIELKALLGIIGNEASSSESQTNDNTLATNHLTSNILASPERLEWEYIQRVLGDNQGNVSATARQLNMHRRTLQRKLSKKPVQV